MSKRLVAILTLAVALLSTAALPAGAYGPDARLDWLDPTGLTVRTTTVYVGGAIRDIAIVRFSDGRRPSRVRVAVASACRVSLLVKRRGESRYASQSFYPTGLRATTWYIPSRVRPVGRATVTVVCDPGW